uniref:Uncharacterized protein n=1 Tax=Streptomyces sp. NBC_00049 TaxID=2903617 RepID=A0AAU2K3V8_9ACTN
MNLPHRHDRARVPEGTPAEKTGPQTGAIPSGEARPEDVGTQSVHYVDGQPVLVVTGGASAPAALAAVEASGNPVVEYSAGRDLPLVHSNDPNVGFEPFGGMPVMWNRSEWADSDRR